MSSYLSEPPEGVGPALASDFTSQFQFHRSLRSDRCREGGSLTMRELQRRTWVLLWVPWAFLCHVGVSYPLSKRTRKSHATSTRLSARHHRPHIDKGDDGGGAGERQASVDRPTQTRTEVPGPPVQPTKPKIVVLGASGKIGRLVVRQLLEMSQLDATVVAYVRDAAKASRVLYDDMLVANSQKKGPKLEIVEGDLISPEDLPGYVDEEEQAWLARAQSAASFYGNEVKDYDDREEGVSESSNEESLQEAIRGCTTIISCVGDVRPTNLWTDFLARPLWRLLRKDVSGWCNDPRHPFYVHFQSTQKVLRLAEREQLRREAATAAAAKEEEQEDEKAQVPRIRFIRISDLCVAEKPWNFVPLLTNTMHSMVFRYQDMAEKTLEASSLIETIALRPGDLCDEERNVTTTSLQVDHTGNLPTPARVGREDVAALAVAAALFDSSVLQTEDQNNPSFTTTKRKEEPPFHYTLACRWAGQEMEPYPAQGKMSHGLKNANLCMRSALRKIRLDEKRKSRSKGRRKKTSPLALQVAQAFSPSRQRIKPYGICVAIPVYLVLTLMLRSLLLLALPYIPGSESLILPAFCLVREKLAVVGAFLLGRRRINLSRILNVISGRGSRQYISF